MQEHWNHLTSSILYILLLFSSLGFYHTALHIYFNNNIVKKRKKKKERKEIVLLCFACLSTLNWLMGTIFQVPISTTNDIPEQPIRLSFPSHHHKVVHRFKCWSVPCNDIHVSRPYRRSGWKPTFSWAEKCSGILLLVLVFLWTLGCILTLLSLLLIIAFLWTLGCVFLILFFAYCFQIVLLLLALVAVPWMLLPKPFLLKRQHEQVCFWILFLALVVCVYVYLAGWGIPCYIWRGFDTHVSFRGSKVNLMHPFQVVMIPSSWIHIMIHMVMRSLSSVRFLCISLFIPLNLCLEQCQIQLPIFVYGL